MRIFGAWTKTDETESSWIAAAETHEDGPIVMMVASRLADGTWNGLVKYRETEKETGSWTEGGFETKSAAMEWCERTASGLDRGRS